MGVRVGRLPDRRHQAEAVLEMLGLSTRPLVRAQAFDSRDGVLVDTSVVLDGQLLRSLARVSSAELMVARFVLDELKASPTPATT